MPDAPIEMSLSDFGRKAQVKKSFSYQAGMSSLNISGISSLDV
jgi:hypothetical protein